MGLLLRQNSGKDVIQMTMIANTRDPEPTQSPWLGVVKFLLLVAMVGLMFMLAHSMVTHRFFRGGWVDQRDVLKP